MNNISGSARTLGPFDNVSIRVLDAATHEVVSEHQGHNAATNSLLLGIAHYLTGDGVLNQGSAMLSEYVPKYMSLGTMGLIDQSEDEEGLPAGIGISRYYDPSTMFTYNQLPGTVRSGLSLPNTPIAISEEDKARIIIYDEELRFVDYLEQCPGYGADGYDLNQNNNRTAVSSGGLSDYIKAGLGPPFDARSTAGAHIIGNRQGAVSTQSDEYDTVKCELISDSFPRQSISYRDILPESQSELPKTVDIVFSAMISTGALAQFRPILSWDTDPVSGKSVPTRQTYMFITEAGLWSKQGSILGGDNGLLAGYRMSPPNKDNWYVKTGQLRPDGTAVTAEEAAANRRILKQSIIRIQVNQVAQIIWKVQLGAIEQLFAGPSSGGGSDPLDFDALALSYISRGY